MSLLSRLPYPLRMVVPTALFCVVIAALISGLSRQRLVPSLVYSLCIGLSCWALIDGSRVLGARLMRRLRPEREEHRHDWPGWPLMLASLALCVPAGYTLGSSLADALLGHRSARLWQDGWRELSGVLLISLGASVMATWFFYSRHRLAASRTEAEQARRQAAEMQLRLLESQLEPHMLFNTLANLRVLIALDAARAQTMLDQLIAFLRATLNASRSGDAHPLRDEFARLADYLALMQVRMGARLRPRLELPPALAELPVPPLLLQPLVENAIKHGLEPHVDGGELIVSACLDGGRLLLEVRDTGAGLGQAQQTQETQQAQPGSGFGLEQVRSRLLTQYGAAASLRIEPADDGRGGTRVRLLLPLPSPSYPSHTP